MGWGVGKKNGDATSVSSLAVSLKVKHTRAIGSSHSALGMYPTEMKTYVNTDTHANVRSSVLHGRQKLGTFQMSLNWRIHPVGYYQLRKRSQLLILGCSIG